MTYDKKASPQMSAEMPGGAATPARSPRPDIGGTTDIDLTRLQRERQAFHILTEAAISQDDLPAICHKVLADLLDVLGFDCATLWLYDPVTRLLNPIAVLDHREQRMRDQFPPQSIDDQHYIGALVARQGEPVFAPDVKAHPIGQTHALRIRELGFRSFIAFPIADASGALIGVVQINASQARSFSPGDRTFFEAVARMFGTIIEHRQAVDALRKSEASYRTLFENAPAALWVEDLSGVKRYLNELRAAGVTDLAEHFKRHPGAVAECAALIRILDVNRQSLELYQARDKKALMTGLPKIMTPQALDGLTRELVAIDAGQTRSATEVENLTLTGEKRQLVMQWFVAPGHENDYGRVLLSFLDVTATRALEAQLLQSQKMESVGTLAGGIAHDFNNIMQAISGYTQLMLWDRGPDDPDYANLCAIEQAAERASKLTRQLLTFSRKVPSALKPVNLNVEIENVGKILAHTIPKMIRIEQRLAGDLCMVNADRSQLELVLMNLGINASNAMPEGGRLVFETRNVFLHQDDPSASHLVDGEGAYVLLSVSDTGHGMDRETRGRIFEPFFTTRDIGQGSGLGLAMVYGIIKNHHGHILCTSEPGQGACFAIYLPAIPAPRVVGGDQMPVEATQPAGRETILVVDDEAAILDLAETLLGRFGYRVLRAENGEQALTVMAAQEKPVDLVILDLNMPGMGGHQCLATLRADYPRVPVLVASGYSPDGSGGESQVAGAAGFIGKPYHLKEMLRVVRNVIDTGAP